jgi:hypothetical protein
MNKIVYKREQNSSTWEQNVLGGKQMNPHHKQTILTCKQKVPMIIHNPYKCGWGGPYLGLSIVFLV